MKLLQVIFLYQILTEVFCRNTRGKREDSGGTVSQPPPLSGGKSFGFEISQRYPLGRSDEEPKIILKKEVPVSFNCSSREPWFTCMWRSPFSPSPCGVFKGYSNSPLSKDCQDWESTANYQMRYENKQGLHVCSIHGKIGVDESHSDEGAWNCRLEVTRMGETDTYDEDNESFHVELLKPASVSVNIERKKSSQNDQQSSAPFNEAEIYDTEEVEITCRAENAVPSPEIFWFLNTKEINFKSNEFRQNFAIIEEEKPSLDQSGQYNTMQKIKYIATLKDNSKYIQCRARQFDDENNKNEAFGENSKFHLYIKPVPLPPGPVVTAEMIGSIIGIIIILILAFLLLAFVWYTKRWCFAVPVVPLVYKEERRPSQFDASTMSYSKIDERSKLLEHSDMQTDMFEDENEDPIKKITKYKTEIILVTDKIANNPNSTKTLSRVESLAKNTAKLIDDMAREESNENLKNRFFLAAQGLTDSVGTLMRAAENSASNPNDNQRQSEAKSAIEELKSTTTQTVAEVHNIGLMRGLEKSAKSAAETFKNNIISSAETETLDPNISKDFLDIQANVDADCDTLEEALSYFIRNPGSATTQSNLVQVAKGYLESCQRWVVKTQQLGNNVEDEEIALKIRGKVDIVTEVLEDLGSNLHTAEEQMEYLEMEAAKEFLQSMKVDLQKSTVESRDFTPQGGIPYELTRNLDKISSSIRNTANECLMYALQGDTSKLNAAIQEMVRNMSDYGETAKEAAAHAIDENERADILNSANEVIDQSIHVLSGAQRVAINPANPVACQNLISTGEKLSKALTAASLLSNEGSITQAASNVVGLLNTELDDFWNAFNAFEIKSIPGKSIEDVSKKLNDTTDDVEDKITKLTSAVEERDEGKVKKGVNEVTMSLEEYKNAAKMATATVTDQDVQYSMIKQSKQVLSKSADMFMKVQKAWDNPADSGSRTMLQNAAKEVVESMADLERIFVYGAPGQEQYVTALNIMKYATRELQNPTVQSADNHKIDIVHLKSRMMTSTKDIAGLAQDIITKSKSDPEQLDGLTPHLAQKYKNLASDINSLLEETGEIHDPNCQEARLIVSHLGQSIVSLIEATSRHQISPTLGGELKLRIAGSAQQVAEHSVRVLSSVNSVAKRALALESIITSLNGITNNLDTTIMFASAGTLNNEQGDKTFTEQREGILRHAQILVSDVQAVLAGATSTKSELIIAAEKSFLNAKELSEGIKAASSCLGPDNQEAQVMLLNTVRDVCGSLQELIFHAKDANGKNIDHPSFGEVKDYSKSVIVNITNLLKSVKTFEDETTRGTKAMEFSIEAIGQEIHIFESIEAPKEAATPEDLIQANRALTQATTKAVYASNTGKQEDILAAANTGRRIIAELLKTCKGAAFTCEDDEIRHQTLTAGRNLAAQYQQLLSLILKSVNDPLGSDENTEGIMSISRTIAQAATQMAKLAEMLKVTDGEWVDPEDPMLIAENELLRAAESIEEAARKLAILRPKGEQNMDKSSYEDMTFNELIIDSAQSIANATSSLIKAASEAQKELVAQGKVQKQIVKGSQDGQWSEGLVSAAKLVATATHSLCEAANNLVQGEGGEEHLIAAARQVSKSTAQLVLACKVKADAESNAMIGLKTAGQAVKKATDALVEAAKGSIEKPPSPKVKVDIFKERIEAEARVLKLEKELAEAKKIEQELKDNSQRTVTDIRKARDAETVVLSLQKELEEAQNHTLRLNEKQYSGM